MAIYISGVKGLPEQVQENKDNIKSIQETISTELNSKISALESKTQKIQYDEANELTSVGTVALHDNGVVEAIKLETGNTKYKDGEMSNLESGIYLVQDGLTAVRIFNSHSGTTHTLDFNDDGSVEVDGNPIIPHLYEHNIVLGDGTPFSISVDVVAFKFLTTSATAFNDVSEIANLLYTRGFNGLGSYVVASGRYNDDSFSFVKSVDFGAQTTDNSYCDTYIIGVYGNNANDLMVVISTLDENTTDSIYTTTSPSNYINDVVVQLF